MLAKRAIALFVLLGTLGGCEPGGERAGPAPGASAPAAIDSDEGSSSTTVDPALLSKTETFGDPTSFFIKASPQQSDGTSVVVEEVVLAQTRGWVVVHAEVDNYFGPILGVSERLPVGTSRDVHVSLGGRMAGAVDSVYAMVHLDGDDNDVFDYPGPDGPAHLPTGAEVVVPIRLL